MKNSLTEFDNFIVNTNKSENLIPDELFYSNINKFEYQKLDSWFYDDSKEKSLS
jgi:hypothetical protein